MVLKYNRTGLTQNIRLYASVGANGRLANAQRALTLRDMKRPY